MFEISNKYFIYLIVGIIISIILILFYIYILFLDRKLRKLEKKIKKDFQERLDFIPILFDLTKGKIKMHKQMFSNILNYRNFGIFNYNKISFKEIIDNEIKIHKELIFLFKVVNKLDSLKNEKDYIFVETFFNKNAQKIGKNVRFYKDYSKILNKLIKIKNYTIFGLLIPVKEKKLI